MEILIIPVILGLLPAAIAHNKGYSFLGWWVLGAMLFIVALPCAIFLKNKSGKKCPKCAEYVDVEARLCKFCRSEL